MTRISDTIIAELGRLSRPEMRVTTFTIATTTGDAAGAQRRSARRHVPHGTSQCPRLPGEPVATDGRRVRDGAMGTG